jgi:hypothetical protein
MDKRLQEAWVTGGDQSDLQRLIDDTNDSTGPSQLDQDAYTFNTDAGAYLADNSPALAPGWQTGYDQATADINVLAADCGVPGVKPNTPQNS